MQRPIISILIGAVLAAVALFVVYNSRQTIRTAEAAAPAMQTTTLYVAASDIAFGERIKADFIKPAIWPTESVPAGAIVNRDEILKGPEGERIAMRAMVAGEPFLTSKLSGYGEKPTLSRKVAEGMRAFSIRINDVSGVAGFLLPGDRVDVQLTRQIGRDRDNQVTDVILQSVTVLGIDQLASEETENPVVARTATVEVTPEQAQKLALAQTLGTLSLTLRNFTNVDEAEVKRVTVSDLAGESRAPVARNNGIYVRVRKGTDVESQRVPQ